MSSCTIYFANLPFTSGRTCSMNSTKYEKNLSSGFPTRSHFLLLAGVKEALVAIQSNSICLNRRIKSKLNAIFGRDALILL